MQARHLAGDVAFWSPELRVEHRQDGTVLISRADPLGAYPNRITERLAHWADVAGDRTWMAQRAPGGEWRRISYGEALDKVRRLGQALLGRGLSADRPVLILSENSIEHALLALAAQYVGVPFAAISPAYSLVSKDFSKLRDIAVMMTPGLLFAADGEWFRPAIEAAFEPGIPVVGTSNLIGGRGIAFNDLLATEPTPAVDAAHAAVGPDTIAKFLFTSGSTGSPKPVIQTQRLLCSNQEMVADCFAFMRQEPPVVVDWAPWNHTASGNKVFNLVLYNGGSYYIDEGKPSPAAIGETIRNLSEISPTWYFNVPAGYEMLVARMERDARLRETFFRNLKLMMYAGAGMAQHTWDALNRLAEETLGHRVLLATGLGSTETGPFALMCTEFQDRAGNVGIPAQGITMKLVPDGERFEARLKGPSVTPGYWRNPELTAAAFDDEGYYRLGDALRFADPADPSRGFFFDGRIAENFKLRTGTWVSVGPLRARLVNHLQGLVRDAVIAGEDRAEIGALLLPAPAAIRAAFPSLKEASDEEALAYPGFRDRLAELLTSFAEVSTGSAARVTRALVLSEQPSLDRGEITDKGSINQRALLRNRRDLVEILYGDDDPGVWREAQGRKDPDALAGTRRAV